MKHASRSFAVIAAAIVVALPVRAQTELKPMRAAAGGSFVAFKPQGEFAENVSSAWGATGHFLYRLDPQGVIALRTDVSFMVYGHERYRTPLGGGPLGLITVDVNTTNSIVLGGIGLQLMPPGETVRPYANGTIGFSYFFTESSVEGSNNSEAFANSTNYEDGGFSWTVGGGLYVPLGGRRGPLNLDLGVRYVDNGKRDYLREDGITFEDNDVYLNPVRSEAKGLQFSLGLSWVVRF